MTWEDVRFGYTMGLSVHAMDLILDHLTKYLYRQGSAWDKKVELHDACC